MMPVGLLRPLISFDGDIILFAYLLGLARFFQILAAMDIGSSFEGMGASREATFSVFAEPIFFFTIGSIAYISGLTSMFENLPLDTSHEFLLPDIYRRMFHFHFNSCRCRMLADAGR